MDFTVLKNIIDEPGSGFVCPLCHAPFIATDHEAVCGNGHSYNFTKPGTINFISKKMNSRDAAFYDNELKLHELAPYHALVDSIKSDLGMNGRLSFTGSSLSSFLNDGDLGFEASSLSVIRQLKRTKSCPLFIAEAARLPLADGSCEGVLRFDEQLDMTETLRILKPGHFMVRILPGQKHLLEVRRHLFSGRRLGLRENQGLLKAMWSMEGPSVSVTHQRISLSLAPSENELDIIIRSLDPNPGLEALTAIRQMVRTVTFDFQVYQFKKLVSKAD